MKIKKFMLTVGIPDDCSPEPSADKIIEVLRDNADDANCGDCAFEINEVKPEVVK